MDFFKSGLKSVLGSPDPGDQPTGAETVERLVDRVQSSSMLEDRRDACRALKALSRKYRIEVGAQGMPALLQVLETDKADCEIVGYALDTLCNITAQEQFDEEADNPQVSVNVGEQFTEMLIKTTDNVALIINYLEEFDFKVRWPAIKLLIGLLGNKPKDIQEIVLVSPMAVSKLMDLLIDSREVIRNDALLLLIQLTKGNANIQKIVAFENAFDRLFDVIKEEGGTDGGIVVEDCMILMFNLLKNNSSNQQFFKEGSFIQRLAPMFVMPPEVDETGITPQKVSNLSLMLHITRALVSPGNSKVIVAACQKTMRTCGLLEHLCNILMSSGVPADILSETINCVGEVVRGDINNQEYLSTVMAPSNPPRPALVVLLMSMVNEKQPLALRCSVLYCFECFLYRNETGQSSLVQTLLPSSNEVSSLTAGQLLCGGLFSSDSVANWFSAVALMYGLIENPAQKEQLLRVLLAVSAGAAPITLLQQSTALLQQAKYKFQSKIGLLMLLSTWQCHCPMAVKVFLETSGAVGFLIAQISANEHDENELLMQGLCAFLMGICIQFNDDSVANYKRDDLCQLLLKRIGLEMFSRKLSEVSRHESYSRAAKQPQLNGRHTADMLLDYEFCKLFKALEAIIVKTISGIGNETSLTELTLSSEASGLVGQYKDIIREQDYKLQALRDELKQQYDEMKAIQAQLVEAQQSNSRFFDQNILLKAQLSAATNPQHPQDATTLRDGSASTDENSHSISHSTQISFYESENARLVKEVSELNDKLNTADAPTNNNKNSNNNHATNKSDDLAQLRRDQEDLLELLSDQEHKIHNYRQRLRKLGDPNVTDDEEDDEE